MTENKVLYIIAGELSGDILASQTLRALRTTLPSYHFRGIGGDYLEAEGLELFMRCDALSVMGITGVLSNIKTLYNAYRNIANDILNTNPEMVICVDFPDMNMLIAKRLRKNGYKGKIIQLVCPTIWAWRPGRKKNIEKYFDGVLCIYPFEKSLFSSEFPVEYIGNPVKERIDHLPIDYNSKSNFLIMFPGSRLSEIKGNLPIFLKAYNQLKQKHPHLKLGISIAKDSLKTTINTIVQDLLNDTSPTFFTPKERFQAMQLATYALATSGTVTLELALLSVPTVVTYHASWLNRFIGKYLVKISVKYFCIANILLDKLMFPELTHQQPTVNGIYNHLNHLISDSEIISKIQADSLELHSTLGASPVAKTSANIIQEWLNKKDPIL